MTEHLSTEARIAGARELSDNKYFQTLLEEQEKAAIDMMVYAKPDDHETRQAEAAFVRAVRNLRARIAADVRSGQAREVLKAPA